MSLRIAVQVGGLGTWPVALSSTLVLTWASPLMAQHPPGALGGSCDSGIEYHVDELPLMLTHLLGVPVNFEEPRDPRGLPRVVTGVQAGLTTEEILDHVTQSTLAGYRWEEERGEAAAAFSLFPAEPTLLDRTVNCADLHACSVRSLLHAAFPSGEVQLIDESDNPIAAYERALSQPRGRRPSGVADDRVDLSDLGTTTVRRALASLLLRVPGRRLAFRGRSLFRSWGRTVRVQSGDSELAIPAGSSHFDAVIEIVDLGRSADTPLPLSLSELRQRRAQLIRHAIPQAEAETRRELLGEVAAELGPDYRWEAFSSGVKWHIVFYPSASAESVMSARADCSTLGAVSLRELLGTVGSEIVLASEDAGAPSRAGVPGIPPTHLQLDLRDLE